MNIKPVGLVLLVALFGCQDKTIEVTQPESSANNVSCQRQCLEGVMDNYLQALAAQDSSRIRVTDDVVFSENNQILTVGDGSWKTFTGVGAYRHYFTDPQTNQVAVISTMRENGEGVIYDLRLRLEGNQISEIESMIIRAPSSVVLYEEMGGPPPNFVEIIPEDQRNSREELLAIPYKYLKGMENNDPNGDYSFFDKDCNRYEHALRTTNNKPQHVGHTDNTTFSTMTCEDQFSGGGLAFVTRIRDERYNTSMVVDEERQSVFGFVFLDHNGTVRTTTRSDGTSYTIPSYFSTPRSLHVGEAWRVRDNKLLEIEMTLTEIPYGERPYFGLQASDNDWLLGENINPNDLRIESECDGQCLNAITENFVSSLVSHDYSNLPLSPSIRYRENGKDLAVGDGLWETATELSDYHIYLSNPELGEAGFFGVITETDVPGLLSAQLKIKDDLIQEINVTVMRHEFTGARGGTLSLFYPQLEGMFNPENFTELEPGLVREKTLAGHSGIEELASIIISDQDGTDSVAGIDNRESTNLLVDAANGLVLQQSVSDISNASSGNDSNSSKARSSGGYSVLTSTLYKFNGNELILKKSVSKPVPYKMPL